MCECSLVNKADRRRTGTRWRRPGAAGGALIYPLIYRSVYREPHKSFIALIYRSAYATSTPQRDQERRNAVPLFCR